MPKKYLPYYSEVSSLLKYFNEELAKDKHFSMYKDEIQYIRYHENYHLKNQIMCTEIAKAIVKTKIDIAEISIIEVSTPQVFTTNELNDLFVKKFVDNARLFK